MKQQTEIYGTLGPACSAEETLEAMFREGMTGIRLNLSHTSLQEAEGQIRIYQQAAAKCGILPQLLIDMQGPELRIGKLKESLRLENGKRCLFVSMNDRKIEERYHQTGENIEDRQNSDKTEIAEKEGCAERAEGAENAGGAETVGSAEKAGSADLPEIPVPEMVMGVLQPGVRILLDDGKILLEIQTEIRRTDSHSEIVARVLRGGLLSGKKSIAIPGSELKPPAMTGQDLENIRQAGDFGVTGVMQPFVRSAEDLKEVRKALDDAGWPEIRLFAKIENMDGVRNLDSFFPYADEIVIARGDLGNAMPLWKLPAVQKRIERVCRAAGKPFMVVTQMLSSMEHSPVPTRAEVSDIYNAVADGAASVMVTGETAVGEYPVDVIRYLARTAASAEHENQENFMVPEG